MPGHLSQADLLELHLLTLPDKAWKEYAEGIGVLTPEISVGPDGELHAGTPDIADMLDEFSRRFAEQQGAHNDK